MYILLKLITKYGLFKSEIPNYQLSTSRDKAQKTSHKMGTRNILTKDRYSSMRHQIKSISHLNLWNIDFWVIVNFNSQIRIDFNSHDLNLNSFYFNINWLLTLYKNQLTKEDTTHSQNVHCLNHLHIKLHMMATEKNVGLSR